MVILWRTVEFVRNWRSELGMVGEQSVLERPVMEAWQVLVQEIVNTGIMDRRFMP
jgi:aryl carrier-like protein